MKDRKWRLVALLMVAFGLRMWRLDAQSLWWDEMATVFRTVAAPSLMWQDLLRARSQVPLYYLLMRPWMVLGERAFWVRYPSVWWGVLTVGLTYQLATRLADRRVATTTAALLTVLPLHIWYSQEARAYTLLGALVVLSYVLLLRVVRHPHDWAGWLAYGTALLATTQTHYFGAFVVLAQAIPMLAHRRQERVVVRRWAWVTGLAVVPLAIWMGIAGAVQPSGLHRVATWIEEAQWYEPLLTFYTFGLGHTADPARWWNWVACAALLVAFGWGVRRLVQEVHAPLVSGLMICWSVVPMVMMWLLSVRLPGLPERRSLYMDRYVTWLLPCFALFVAWGWEGWRRHHGWAWGAAALSGVAMAISLIALYTDPAYAREDWRGAVERMSAVAEGDAVLVRRAHQLLPLWIYRPSEAITVMEAPDGPPEGDLASWLGTSAAPDEVWLITVRENINPHGFPQGRNEALEDGAAFDGLKTELDARYPVTHRFRFPGVVVSCYGPAEGAHGG